MDLYIDIAVGNMKKLGVAEGRDLGHGLPRTTNYNFYFRFIRSLSSTGSRYKDC